MLGFDSEYLDLIEEASDRWSYFQRKGALTMFEQEVDYRLAKWLLADIAHQGVITHSEMLKAWEELLAYYIVARMSRQKSIKFLMNQAAAFAASSSMAG